jgi:glc operon protein GlcG
MASTRQFTVVTLETALAVVQRALAEAEKRGIQASVVVVDPGMNLIVFAKADGATPHSVYSSRSKANAAASTRRPTGWMGADLALSIPLATELRLTNIKGGYPLNFGGTVSGAIGVAGGTPDQDAEIAAAAAAYASEL